MGTRGLRKCCHCGVWFRPHPRNTYHQRFCTKGECRAASKSASQHKWLRKNQQYFRGERAVDRVQQWRRDHPGYWIKKAAGQSGKSSGALQDLLISQHVDNELVNAIRNRLVPEISLPLQDLLTVQQLTLVGLTCMITGDALQEDIAQVLASCYERGQRIGGSGDLWRGAMRMHKQEVSYEGTRSYSTEAAHPAAVQLGRSPPGT